MMELLIKTTIDYFLGKGQMYLGRLYAALFSTTYYGLLHVSELTSGAHPIKVGDVQIGMNKQKILFILRTSKTHNRGASHKK